MRPLVTYTAIGFFFRKEKIRLFLIFFFVSVVHRHIVSSSALSLSPSLISGLAVFPI